MKNNHNAQVYSLLGFVLPGLTLRKVLGAGGLVAGAFAFLTLSPYSPTALDHADHLMSQGQIEQAVERYEAVADKNLSEALRIQAHLRAALLQENALSNPGAAKTHLQSALTLGINDTTLEAEVWERLGALLALELHEDEAAALAYRMAYDVLPEHQRAPVWLLEAARSRSRSHGFAGSRKDWNRLSETFPEQEGLALVSQAALLIEAGQIEVALEYYENAIDVSTDQSTLQVAHLGAATCLERIGRLDAAVADLESSDLPTSVRDSRIQHLEDMADAY